MSDLPAAQPYTITIEVDDAFRAQVDVANLEEAIAATLRHQGVVVGALNVIVTDDEEMRALRARNIRTAVILAGIVLVVFVSFIVRSGYMSGG